MIKKLFKVIMTAVCLLAGIASFLYLCMRNRDVLGEYYARTSINVEIDKQYAQNIAVAIETSPNPCSYWMSPTTTVESDMKNIIMHISIPLKRPFWKPAIQVPRRDAEAALAAIDNIAVFVGNKLIYFSHEDVQQFQKTENDDYALYYMPNIFYEKSLVFKNWSNYYGDINFGVKALTAFFIYPARFAPVYILLALLLFMYRKQAGAIYAAAMRNKKISCAVLLAMIIFAGFVLRWNGYVRHSGWTDEIYSAVRTGNPTLPFISAFGDTGNPPFYFILLRFWFKLFGWSEEAGTMLSVLLGTFSIGTLYLFVKPFFGRKAALCAALFVAVSGFSIGYSNEMRGYILKMFLVPLIALALLHFIKKPSIKNLVLYALPSIGIVNTHYYGIVFIMANYLFYVVIMLYKKQWQWKKALLFTGGNIVIALSFLPFFLYMLFEKDYDFSREFSPTAGHSFVFFVIVIFIAAFFLFRKEIEKANIKMKIIQNDQTGCAAYLLLAPAFIFSLAYIISFFKPMISFRYLWPINAPFFFALAAAGIFRIHIFQKWRFAAPLLIYMFVAGLHGLIPDIPSGGTEGYKEARAYIAADAAAHPERKAAMLDNAPHNAAYYHYPNLPGYAQNPDAEVVYIYNDIFHMHEIDMYAELRRQNLEDSRMLKIYFDYEYPRADGGVIFKKYQADGFDARPSSQ